MYLWGHGRVCVDRNSNDIGTYNNGDEAMMLPFLNETGPIETHDPSRP